MEIDRNSNELTNSQISCSVALKIFVNHVSDNKCTVNGKIDIALDTVNFIKTMN